MFGITRKDIGARRLRKDYYPWKTVRTKSEANKWATKYRARSKGNRARVIKTSKGYTVYVK